MKQEIVRLLGLTKNEQLVVRALSHMPIALTEVEKQTKLPHASVADTLARLVRREVVEVVHSAHRKKYICTIETRFSKHGSTPLRSLAGVEIYDGKDSLLSLVSSELLRHRHDRLLSFHGERVAEGWLAVLPLAEIKKRNELIIEHDIIVERFVPERGYKRMFKKFSKEWQNTMVGRTHITHFLPDAYFDTRTELMMFSNVVMLYETHRERIVLFRDVDTVSLYASFFEMLRTVGHTVDSEAEFRAYLKER